MRALGLGIGPTFGRRMGAVAPPSARIDFTGSPVAENVAAGAVLGALTIANATGTPTYTLTNSDGNRVALSGANVVRGATALDFETHPLVTFSVSVTGMTPAPSAGTFDITITDIAEGVGDPTLALDLDFTTMTTLDPRVTFTRAGPAMMYDATGKLTTAPNNMIPRGDEFTHASWSKEGTTVTAGVADLDGGTTASTVTVTGGTNHTNRRLYWGTPLAGGTVENYLHSIWMRRRTGSGAVYMYNNLGSYVDISSQVSSSWARVFIPTKPTYFIMALAGASDAIDIWHAQGEIVTYETTPRTFIPTTTAATHGPRFDHDPVTLAARGLLLEEQRTNSALRSTELNNAAWVTSSTLSVTADATIAPDGTTTADLLTAITPTGSFMFQTVSLAGVAVSSVYVKKGTADWVYLKPQGGDQYFVYFNINTGVVGANAGGAIAVSITNVGNGWWRITAGRTTLTYFGIGICDANSSPNVTAGKTAYFWGGQAEVGSFATSYIPTTTAAVTRAADSASMSGTNFTSWYNQTEGTFVLAMEDKALGTNAHHLNVNASSNPGGERAAIYNFGGTLYSFISVAGSVQNNETLGAITTAPYKAAFAMKLNDTGLCLNGGTPFQDGTFTMGTPNRLFLGAAEDGVASRVGLAYFKRLTFYNTRKSNAELQGLTAPAAALDLDFTSGTLDPRITFARAGTATYYNSAGVLSTAATNTARFDYDPVTLQPRGLLLEEQRTNSQLHSQDFANAAWTGVTATITANQIVAPDGTTTADMVTAGGAGDCFVYNATFISLPSGCNSCYLKKGTSNFAYLGSQTDLGVKRKAWFNLNTGTVGTVEAGLTATIINVGNGWYRCSVYSTSVIYYLLIGVASSDGGLSTGTQTIYAWGAQSEAGAFPTSYIPTVAAAVTRSADIASMTGTNFSSWYTVGPGTVIVAASSAPSTGGTSTRIWDISNLGTYEDSTYVSPHTAAPNRIDTGIISGGAFQAQFDLGAFTPYTALKVGLAWAVNDVAATLNGGTVQTDTSATLTARQRLTMGSYGGTAGFMTGHISRLTYYNTRKSNAELQALTT